MPTRRMGVFCKNLGITHNIYFKKIILKFLFYNGSIIKINDHYNRSRGNEGFTELSEIINTMSNQDFTGLDWIKQY